MAKKVLSSLLPVGFLWLRVTLGVLTAWLPIASVSEATLHDTGQWSESEYGGYGSNWATLYGNNWAIHMAITRGEGSPYHSHILWWDGSRYDFGGRELAWQPVTNDCAEWPEDNFTGISVAWPTMNAFCSGHNTLADGRLLIAGGNDSVNSIAGERGARIWEPGASQNSSNWTNANTMREHRWYPTTTMLADGRVLVLNGYQNEHHAIFGGRLDGAIPSQVVADSLRLYEPVPGGQWFQSTIPDSVMGGDMPHKPAWREYHSAACMELYRYGQFTRHQVYFGGKDAAGHALGDTWLLKREDNLTGADFKYKWEKGPTPSLTTPAARSEHTAVGAREPDESMYVFGGLDRDSVALPDLQQLYWNTVSSPPAWAWRTPSDSGDAPLARYGHAAFYDEIPGPSNSTLRRMILFGGAGDTTNTALADSSIYEMRITGPSTVSWTVMNKRQLGSGSPSPRFGHAMDVDLVRAYKKVVSGDTLFGHIAVLYGGQSVRDSCSSEFWLLWIFNDGTVGWEKANFGGGSARPTARKHATLVFDPLQGQEDKANGEGRAYLFGGEDQYGTPIDKDQYAVDPFGANPRWFKWAQAGKQSTGHTTILQQEVWAPTARVAEVYDPTSGWTAHTSANLFQNGYAPTFLVPGHTTGSGRVFSMAVDDSAYHLDVGSSSSGTWTPYTHGGLGFDCEGVVMYRPGKILAASGFNRGDCDTCWVGRSMKFDTEGPDSLWKQAAYGSGAGSLTPRLYHNLCLLPDGKVIAIGGLRCQDSEAMAFATKRPQIWDPDGAGGMGAWTDSSQLAIQAHGKNYHSTAILLPDGRILSAGGSTPNDYDMYYADLYSPPYLFNGDALATRPTLISATGRWRYNADVTFSVSGDTVIRRACLIRAPSTTHAFDHSQRYVPLTLLSSTGRGDGARQYFLKAPPDSFTAPPGDYMLFASDSFGVPAIAKWIRVGSTYTGQFDSTRPDTVNFGAEFVGRTQIYLNWIAPGDDSLTGTALDYDVRYSTSPVTTSSFSSCTRLTGLPIPLLAGTLQRADTVAGLDTCRTYYFGGKTRDRAEHWSALGRRSVSTLPSGLCYGGTGDDYAAHRARDEDNDGRPAPLANALGRVKAFAMPSGLIGSGSPLRLVATCSNGEATTWMLTYQDLSTDDALLAATTSELLVQEPMIGGGWSDRSMLPVSPGLLGVRSLLRGGRVVFPARTSLEAIQTAPLSYLCTQASHSRLGNLLLTGAPLDSVSIESSAGDTLLLEFTAEPSSTAGADNFFTVMVGGGEPVVAMRPERHEPSALDLPTSFALYPAHPNPFSGQTTIRFDLPKAANVQIELFDVQGRRVTTLTHQLRVAGRHSIGWNGQTDHGARAAAGIYLCRMRAGDFTAEKRISLLP